MSTFKNQPIYASIVFDLLDPTTYADCPYTARDVADLVAWDFEGGTLGDYETKHETSTSGNRYPEGPLSLLVSNDGTVDWSLRAILASRKRERRLSARIRRSRWAMYRSIKAFRGDVPGTVVTGLRAVYMCVKIILSHSVQDSGNKWWREMSKFTTEFMSASAEASRLHVATIQNLADETLHACHQAGLPGLERARRIWGEIVRESRSSSSRLHSRKVGRDESAVRAKGQPCLMDKETFWCTSNLVMVKHQVHKLALSRSDCDRVTQFVRGYSSGLFATVAQAACAPGQNRSKLTKVSMAYAMQVNRMLAIAAVVPPQKEVYVCKGLKRAYGAYLGELAGPLCSEETIELWNEAYETPYVPSHLLDSYVSELRTWDISTACNLGKVYKLCPAPDSCPGSALIDRHIAVSNSNTCMAEMVEEFQTEHLAQILRAYVRAPGVALAPRDTNRPQAWYPSYRRKDFDNVPSANLATGLAWEGSAAMPIRSAVDPSVWKDSGLGWDTTEEAFNPDRDKMKSNMLTRMVFDPECPMPGTAHSGHEHTHKAELKPEGHKKPQRIIFSGNIRDRQNQSWMEQAVENVARFHPSYMIGADIPERDAKVANVLHRNLSVDTIDVYYSFDIKGWSPLMPGEIQRASHKNWGDLYGEQLFLDAWKINEQATVYMNKGGYEGTFVNPSANFEGYNGKEMTMVLLTLMAMSVKNWRAESHRSGLLTEEQSESLSVTLMGYIDDGLAKATIPRQGAVQLFSLWKNCTRTTFKRCGFTLEVNKCYPSDRFSIFLNEIYYMGRHVVHGTRAAMTMCAEGMDEKLGLMERLVSVSTGARGAVAAGLDVVPATLLMCYHSWEHILHDVPYAAPGTAAVWAATPVNWGGLGLPTMLQMSTSGGGASTEESAYMLNLWARHSVSVRKLYTSVAREGYEARNARGIVTSPLGGRVNAGVIPSSPMSQHVRRKLTELSEKGELGILPRQFLALAADRDFEALCSAALQSATVIQEQVLDDLYAALPHSVFTMFSSRIEKSNTLRKIVGSRVVDRVRRELKTSARRSYDILRMKLYH